MGAIKTRT